MLLYLLHLYCLQWPGVYCMTAEEEEAAEAGLRAAGRASSGLVELQLCGLEFAVRWGACVGTAQAGWLSGYPAMRLLAALHITAGGGRQAC